MSRTAISRLRSAVPQGGLLPAASWDDRHRWIVRLLCLHLVVIPAFGLFRDYSGRHMLLETAVVALAAVGAQIRTLSRRQRAVIASFGLMSCSGILVHLSGGLIEMHFHFFVMVAVVSLYQDWAPLPHRDRLRVRAATACSGSSIRSRSTTTPTPCEHPWRWAGIHAAFIAAESVACLVELAVERVPATPPSTAPRVEAESARRDLALLVDASEALTSSFDVDVMLAGLVVAGRLRRCPTAAPSTCSTSAPGSWPRTATAGMLAADAADVVLRATRAGAPQLAAVTSRRGGRHRRRPPGRGGPASWVPSSWVAPPDNERLDGHHVRSPPSSVRGRASRSRTPASTRGSGPSR